LEFQNRGAAAVTVSNGQVSVCNGLLPGMEAAAASFGVVSSSPSSSGGAGSAYNPSFTLGGAVPGCSGPSFVLPLLGGTLLVPASNRALMPFAGTAVVAGAGGGGDSISAISAAGSGPLAVAYVEAVLSNGQRVTSVPQIISYIVTAGEPPPPAPRGHSHLVFHMWQLVLRAAHLVLLPITGCQFCASCPQPHHHTFDCRPMATCCPMTLCPAPMHRPGDGGGGVQGQGATATA
jgi:hypothetical protein